MPHILVKMQLFNAMLGQFIQDKKILKNRKKFYSVNASDRNSH